MATTRFIDHLLPPGDHASRPDPGDVPQGAIYPCTTHAKLEQSDGASWSDYFAGGGGGGVSVALLQDQKAQNTAGGTFTSGAQQTRVLNTEVSDVGNIVILASNQFTPIAGTYVLRATAPCRAVNRHQARLRNVTAGTTTQLGSTGYSAAAGTGDNVTSVVDAVFTANGTDAYEIQHICETTASTNGFGVAANLAGEVYTSVLLMKIA